MHSRNVTHRDLKPENIMFADKELDEIKIIDFGLSKRFFKGQAGSDSLFQESQLFLQQE